MTRLAVGIFFLCLLCGAWFGHKASQHRKDPEQVFYLGNVAPSGRKYVWLGCLTWVVALIAWLWVANH